MGKSTTKQNKNSHFLVKSIFFSNPQKRFHFLEIIMNSIGRIGSRIITQQRCFQRNNVCLQNTRQKNQMDGNLDNWRTSSSTFEYAQKSRGYYLYNFICCDFPISFSTSILSWR